MLRLCLRQGRSHEVDDGVCQGHTQEAVLLELEGDRGFPLGEAQALHEDTFVYIEGTNVALGGERFGDVIRVFSAADGALTLTEGEATISLQLQQDGFLRLTVAGPEPATLYLMPAPIPGQAPAQEP